MCKSPLLIPNSSRRYTEGVSPRHFVVPCGHCYDCQKRQQDDWYVRSFFEYRRIKDSGSCWFFTLTYNNDSIPTYIDNDYIEIRNGIQVPFVRPCFSVEHLKKFRDRLRTYLSRAGFKIDGIRFFFSCELGGKFGRPHYHPLLFLPFKIPFKKLWDILNKAWNYGIVGFSKKYGMLVTSDRAVQYACKYVSKDSAWFRYFGLDDYLYHLVKSAKEGNEDSEIKLRNFRRSYRLHFQSMKYGSEGLNIFSDSNGTLTSDGISQIIDDNINLYKFGQVMDKAARNGSFSVPSYYKRKLLYDKDSNNLDIKNANYDLVVYGRYDYLLHKFIDRLEPYLRLDKFIAHVAPLKLPFPETQFEVFSELLKDSRVKPTCESIARFVLSYSDVPFPRDNGHQNWPLPVIGKTEHWLKYIATPQECFDLLMDKSKEFYCKRSYLERSEPDPEGHSRLDEDKQHFFGDYPSYSDLPCFFGYEQFINEVAFFETQLGRLVNDSKVKVDDEKFNFARISGIIDDKYSFMYNPIFEEL